MNILVTDGDERAALAVTRSLGRSANIHVVGPRNRSLSGASRFSHRHHRAPPPLEDRSGFAAAVRQLCVSEAIDIVFPISDAASRALIPLAAELGATRLAAPSLSAYETLSHKSELIRLARSAGLQIPEGREVHNVNEAAEVAQGIGWPVVVKPVESVAGVYGDGAARKYGVAIVAEPRDFASAWAASAGEGAALIQRCVPGWGEGLFALRWGGELRAVFAHRRIREKPPSGGVSVLRESIAIDGALLRQIAAVLDEVDLEGVAMAEFKTDCRERWLMEFNVRFWGSLQLAIDAGVDFPALWIAAMAGEPAAPVGSYGLGVRSRWLLGDLDHAIAIARGRPGPDGRTGWHAALKTALGPAGPNSRWEVLRPSDPRPFAHELRGWLHSLRS